MNILVADDDPVVQFLLQSMLSSLGHTITQATSGEACLAALVDAHLVSNSPDIVFLDMMLGDLPGSEVLKSIRSLYTPCPKVIMVSANPSSELRDLDVQPDFYLEKPFTLARVTEALEAILGGAAPPE